MTDLSPVAKRTPDAEHTFWVYSPEGDGMTFWKTEQERDDYAKREIQSYLDDRAWGEEVEWVCAGVVTHRVTAVDIIRRVGELDDEGYDENGEYWEPEAEIKCNYALHPNSRNSPMTDPTPNGLSHLSNAEFQTLCPQGEHAPGPEPLSPAQVIVKTFNDRYELLGPLEDDWQEQCLAAALGALADQVVSLRTPFLSPGTAAGIRADILAITTELENYQ